MFSFGNSVYDRPEFLCRPRRRWSPPQRMPVTDFYNYIPARSVPDYEEVVQCSVPMPECEFDRVNAAVPICEVDTVSTDMRKYEIDRVNAAVQVQSAIRRFLVRKNVTVLRELEEEVRKIENEVAGKESSDRMEKLRLNETLMRILFRLDSVRGARDYRKKVIRKAIQIQDVLDV